MNKIIYNGNELDRNTNLDNYVLDYIDENGDSHLRLRNNYENIEYYKQKLKDSDYKAIKYAEGLITYDEYLPIKNQREEYRKKINVYENMIKNS